MNNYANNIFCISQIPFLLSGNKKRSSHGYKGSQGYSIYHEEKDACWRPQGLAPLVTLQGWVLNALSWQGLALLVTLWGWVQRTLSWEGFTSSKKTRRAT